MSLLYFFVRLAIAWSISALSASVDAFARLRVNNSMSALNCSSRRRFCSTNDAYSVNNASVCCFAFSCACFSALSRASFSALSSSVPSLASCLRFASMTFNISMTVFAFDMESDNSLLNASRTVFFVSSAMASFSWRNCLFCVLERLATSTCKMMSRWFFK